MFASYQSGLKSSLILKVLESTKSLICLSSARIDCGIHDVTKLALTAKT
jgi:hypothetical protein